MAIVSIDVSGIEPGLNKRSFLRAAGFDVKDRGSLSKDQTDVLAAAVKAGYEFEAPAKVAEKVEALVSQSDIDLLAFREWQISKGRKAHEKGRISQAELNEYVTEVPDFARREVPEGKVKNTSTGKVELKPLPKVDPKAVKRWADSKKLEYPERGRLPRYLIESYLAANEDAGTVAPEPENVNNFGPAAPRINFADWYEAYEFSYDTNGEIVVGDRVNNERGGALVKKSFKDVDVKTGYSIGYVPGYSFTFDPRDSDEELVLLPAN